MAPTRVIRNCDNVGVFLILTVSFLCVFSGNSPIYVNGNFIKSGYRAISHFYGALRPTQVIQVPVPATAEHMQNVTVTNNGTSSSHVETSTRRHIASFTKLKSQIPTNTPEPGVDFHSTNGSISKMKGRELLESLGLVAIGKEIMTFFRPYFIASGNLLADIQEAVPNDLTGIVIATVMFKGIIFATIMMLKVILLPLPFWILLGVVFAIGGYLYTVSLEKGHEDGEEDARPLSELFENDDDDDDAVSRKENTYYGQEQSYDQLSTQAVSGTPIIKYSQPIQEAPQEDSATEYKYSNYYAQPDDNEETPNLRRVDYDFNNYYGQQQYSQGQNQNQDQQGLQKRRSEYADYTQYYNPPATVIAPAATQQYSYYSPYSILSSTNCSSCFQPVQHSLTYYQN